MSYTVEFFVDTTYTSPLLVLSPQNMTYTTTEVPLTFICREENRYDGNFTRAGYVLDGIGSYYFYENLTLTDLSIGNHTIDVTVWTDNYQFFSKIIYFTVSNQTPTAPPIPSSSPTQQPTIEPRPTLDNIQAVNFTSILIIFGLVALSVVLGLLVYFKKSKVHRSNE